MPFLWNPDPFGANPLPGPIGVSPRRFLSLLLTAVVLIGSLSGCLPGAPATEQGWSAPVAADGAIYIGSRSGRFFKIAATDVSEAQPLDLDSDRLVPQWQFPVGQQDKTRPLGAIYGQPELAPDMVYIALNRVVKGRASAGVVTALDRQSGIQRWSYETSGRVFGGPVFNGASVYAADDEGNVYSLDAANGALRWKQPVAAKRFWSTPTITGDTLYIGSMDHKLYALSATDGSAKWNFEAKGAITSKPLALGDSLYFGALDRQFYRVNAISGEIVWSFTGDGWFWNDATASADGGTVYVGSLGESFYAIDALSGVAKWTFATDEAVRAAPVVVGGLVYVVAKNGRIFALDRSTGQPRRSAPILGEQALASPAWANGFLYIHDMKEELHKIAAPL